MIVKYISVVNIPICFKLTTYTFTPQLHCADAETSAHCATALLLTQVLHSTSGSPKLESKVFSYPIMKSGLNVMLKKDIIM